MPLTLELKSGIIDNPPQALAVTKCLPDIPFENMA
jgi:hypothetical protein